MFADGQIFGLNPEAQGYNFDESWINDIETTQFKSFVKEWPEMKKEIQKFAKTPTESAPIICNMLTKYQENPELLDPHLQEMVNMIMEPVKANIDQRAKEFIDNPNFVINRAFEIIYTLTNVRGYKTVIRYLPHEVSDLEPTLNYLLAINHENTELWYTRYCLCLWLAIIILIPFDLKTVDSEGGMIKKIMNLVKKYLCRSEKSREGASVLISKVFSRPDFQQSHLVDFLQWCKDILDDGLNQDIFLLVGVFQSLSEICKHSHRDILLDKVEDVLQSVTKVWKNSKSRVLKKYVSKLAQRIGLVYLKPVIAKWRYTKGRQVLLPDSNESKQESNEEKSSEIETTTQPLQTQTQTQTQNTTNTKNIKNTNETQIESKEASDIITTNPSTDEIEFDVPSEIEAILDQLLRTLSDRDTVVRWSAAKGIGRIVMRLPLTLGDQVVSDVLDRLKPTEDSEAWHGGCLALAELARRGLLLPKRLEDTINRIEKAMLYDKFQGTHSKGDHVRDAACYVAWAFARAYEPSIMQPYVARLARGLVVMASFDREIHCRRAAAAAFQENVGRQGNFPHGIEINTSADYWTVGLISNAYLNVSKSIAKFDEYRLHMINHLVNVNLSHWELKIRKLSGETVYKFVELDPKYFLNDILPRLILRCESKSLFERHGALYGISKIVLRLYELNMKFDEKLQKNIRNIIPRLEKNRGYTGRGGEYVREASCLVLKSIATAKLPLSDKALIRYEQTMDDNLKNAQSFVQKASMEALRVFSNNYYINQPLETQTERMKRLTVKWSNELKNEINASVTRGYARGLGALVKPLVFPHLKLVVDTLIFKSFLTKNEDLRDFETRKMCILSLADLVENIGISHEYTNTYKWEISDDSNNEIKNDELDSELEALGIKDVTKEVSVKRIETFKIIDEQFIFQFDITNKNESSLLYDRILSAIMMRFNDYEIDKRGDIGSFVREHSLMAMTRVILALQEATINDTNGYVWLRPCVAVKYLQLVFTQLSEKLDRVRRAAGNVVELLFCSENKVASSIKFPHREFIVKTINAAKKRKNEEKEVRLDDWSVSTQVFPIVVQFLNFPEYRLAIWEGLFQCLGNLSSEMATNTLKIVEPYFISLKNKSENGNKEALQQLRNIGNDINLLLEKRQFCTLFIMPFYKALGTLLTGTEYFNPLKTKEEQFALRLANSIKVECRQSRDIRKLIYSVQCVVGLTLFPNTYEIALQRLMIYLGYSYPALRKETANRLLGALCTWIELGGENNEDIQDFLTENSWIGDLNEIREKRNKLFPLFGIKSPKLKKKKPKN